MQIKYKPDCLTATPYIQIFLRTIRTRNRLSLKYHKIRCSSDFAFSDYTPKMIFSYVSETEIIDFLTPECHTNKMIPHMFRPFWWVRHPQIRRRDDSLMSEWRLCLWSLLASFEGTEPFPLDLHRWTVFYSPLPHSLSCIIFFVLFQCWANIC